MQELIPHADRTPAFLPPREEFAQITDLATRLSGTEFVPGALRGNPPAVLAAMLTGRELGLAPMESLRSIHMIEGRPTLSAEATMKLAQEAGHLLIVVETTRERATVKYRNASWPDDEPARELTFDLEDADLAGLKGRSMWNKYPRAMLRSRAITEAARAGGLLSGAALAYTSEELTDDDDLEAGTVDVEIVRDSISPDAEDEDELETRRELHRRAAAAYRRATELDKETAGTAWAAASAGLGDNPWRDSDLDVLTIRVEDLERVVAQLEDEHPDEDGDGGATPPDDGDEPDDGPVTPDEAPAPETATQSDDVGGVTAGEALAALAPDDDGGLVGQKLPVEPAEGATPDGDTLAQLEPRSRLEAIYGELTVAHVSDLIRNGETTIEYAGGELRVYLPTNAPGAKLHGLELIDRLEDEHHDPRRKTVGGLLESAGWTPRGRKRLEAARARADVEDPDPRHAHETAAESGEGDEAATAGSDDAPDALTRSQRVEALLDRWDRAIEDPALTESVRRGFRAKLAHLITEAEDGVPDPDRLEGIVRHLERA